MPKNMNDVNEMRELAAESCGEVSRLIAQFEPATDDDVIIIYGLAMRDAGQLVQHAADIEAWVTLRERIDALRVHHEGNPITLAVIADVIDYMDELEVAP